MLQPWDNNSNLLWTTCANRLSKHANIWHIYIYIQQTCKILSSTHGSFLTLEPSWHHPTNSLTCVEITLGTFRKLLEGSQSQIRQRSGTEVPRPEVQGMVGDDPCKGFHSSMIVCSTRKKSQSKTCVWKFWDFLHLERWIKTIHP